MSEDFETLKAIRDKEKSVDQEIEEFEASQKKLFEEAQENRELEVSRKKGELDRQYNETIDKLKKELEEKKNRIIEEGKAKASKISIKLSDSDIEKIALKALMDYLEG